MKKVFAVTAALALLCLGGLAQAAITIDTVAVGNAGNAADTTGYGSVGYNYNIGKYEVTAGQYTDFLNAVAATDTYGLYNTAMADPSGSKGCNIQRTGAAGSYTYSVANNRTDGYWANLPVNYVSFWDSCRFANWLGNGQGNGDTETGAYTLTADGIANNTITRNEGATWAVTSEDEWYKAAYYKGDGLTAGYWQYPTCSNTAPGRNMADSAGNNANYYNQGFLIGSPYYRTEVGEFQNSGSPYGTFDQGGNILEWNETIIFDVCRALRGSSFEGQSSDYIRASYRNLSGAFIERNSIGFRVSEVPEPASIIALVGGLISLLGIRRRPADVSRGFISDDRIPLLR
jgi:formylglycine-generating enzyme required for sulfatase activity